MRIAFDINHTIREIVKGVGGVDYAQTIARKLGLDTIATVIPKGETSVSGGNLGIDLCFDDEDIQLASVNIKIKRKPLDNL